MKVISSVAEAAAHAQKTSARRVLVPTMGALHKGHIELMRVARERAGNKGEVAVSIFVNPLQFEPGSDLGKYPRPEKIDEELCRAENVDLLFRPNEGEMYFEDPSVFVEETSLSQTLCGKARPGHFRGVCTVVTKLFNIIRPNAAVFGEKDFQQLAIIRRMVRDLNFQVDIIPVPTVREKDGLACSSRNQYLSAEERKQAPLLRAALLKGREMAGAGEKSAGAIVSAVKKIMAQASAARVDYVELVDAETLQPRDLVEPNSLLALAVFFGQTRLIDNIRL